MKKFKDIQIEYQAVRVYSLSLIVSLIISPLFGKFYIRIFNSPQFGDFFTINDPNALLDGAFFAYFLFLSFFVFWLVIKKQWLVWIIGIILPILIALSGGMKDIFWVIILSFTGWILAQLVHLFRKKVGQKK